MITRADIERRLAEALHHDDCPYSHDDPPCRLAIHREDAVREWHRTAKTILNALGALAREPGGAEAVAAAVGLRAVPSSQVEHDHSAGYPGESGGCPTACRSVLRARIVAAVEKEPGT